MSVKNNPFQREKSGLVKELKWSDVAIMSIAAPAASGILFYSVNMQADFPGGNLSLAFLIGMIAFLPIILLISMLSSSMPRAGSLYVSVSRIISPHLAYIGAMLYIIGQGLVAGILGNIIINILGDLFLTAYKIYSIEVLNSIGQVFVSKTGNLIGGFFWVLFFWFISLKGMRIFKKTIRVFFWIPLLCCFVIISYFLFIPEQSVISAFNSNWGQGSFSNVIETANNNGFGYNSFSFTQTISLLLVVIWSYNGIEMACYAGSEIHSPKKSIIKGFFSGWIGVGVLYIVLSLVIFKPFGEFVGAFDFSSDNSLLSGSLANISPSIPFYFLSICKSKILGLTISFLIILWFVNSIPPLFLSTSRIVFSLAMDRSIPKSFAEVDLSNGAPKNAIHLVALIALIGVVLQTYDVKIVISTAMFCAFFIFWMYGLTGIVLPYKKPELLKDMPLNRTFLGFHLVSIFGLLTFFIGWFFVFITLKEIVNNNLIILMISLIITAVIVLFMYQANRNKKDKIKIEDIYSQLPPE
jgi:amino acid transporter